MKTKTSLWLGVCTLVLCLGVMTFGVYSAISANLNMSGKLGFNMHNCMVTVQGTVYNLAEIPEGQNYANRIDKPIERTIMGGENTTTASISLGDMYFYYGAYIDPETDTITSKVYDMIFEISFKNVSSTAIKATIPAPTVGAGVTIVTDSASGYTTLPVSDAIIEQNATYTVKFALHLNSLNALSNNVNFSWNNITFEEYIPPVLQGNNIKYNLTANNASMDVTSTKKGYSTGGTAYEKTRQPIQMDNDNTISVTNTNTDGKGTTAEVNVGTLNFSDTDPIQPIVLTLTATNKSNTKVASMIVIDEIHDANYTIEYAMGTNPDAATTAYEGAVILDASASVTFTITLTSTNPKEPSTNDLIISANFTKYDTNIENPYIDEQGLYYVLNDDYTAWSVYGVNPNDYSVSISTEDVEIQESAYGLPVTIIGEGAFANCDSLTSVTIPNSVTIIGEGAFDDCWRLTSVNIPDSVTIIGISAFYRCSELTSVSLGNSVTIIGDYAFYDCSLTSVTIPDSVTIIGEGAFDDCWRLTSVSLGNSVTIIGSYAFYSCGSLTSVTIPDSVESIDEFAFYNCTSLTSVSLGNSVTTIGNSAFNCCSSLTSITIPDGVTSIGDGAFAGCKSLTSVSLGNSVTIIGIEAFAGCDSLTSINIPNSVTIIGDYAFDDCASLTSVTIPDSVTSIGVGAFDYCNLNSITVSTGNTKYDSRNNCNAIIETASNTLIQGCNNSTIPYGVTSIGNNAFISCDSLTSITIPDSVTIIGDYAFANCDSLTSINIPNSVTTIGKGAFSYCTSLTSVYIDGATALSTAVSNYSNSYIFNYTTAVYIQKDVNMSGYTKFTKQGTDEYSYNGKIYYKYTESYY